MSSPGRFEPRRRARRRALQALYLWHINPQDVPDILGQFREEQDFSQVDERFFEALVTGVVADHEELEQGLAEFLDRPFAQLDVMERAVLLLGAWELLRQPDTPHQVILDEAVDLARRFGAEQGHSYINGVLDRAAQTWRQGDSPEKAESGG